jgi:hypothetical protein
MKGLYNENYKPVKKEIEEGIRRWKALPCSWIGRINITRIAIQPKEIPIQISMKILTKTEKSTLKMIWK